MNQPEEPLPQTKKVAGKAGAVVSFGCFGCLGIAVLGFFALIIGMFIDSYQNAGEASDSESWPHVNGVIVSSEVSSHRKRSGSSSPKTVYSADVTYNYTVDGTEYSGTRVSFGDYNGSQAMARSVVKRYPVKKTVSVYYDPENPSECTLETGLNNGVFFSMGFTTLVLIFIVVIPILAIFQKIRKNKRQVSNLPE